MVISIDWQLLKKSLHCRSQGRHEGMRMRVCKTDLFVAAFYVWACANLHVRALSALQCPSSFGLVYLAQGLLRCLSYKNKLEQSQFNPRNQRWALYGSAGLFVYPPSFLWTLVPKHTQIYRIWTYITQEKEPQKRHAEKKNLINVKKKKKKTPQILSDDGVHPKLRLQYVTT